MARRIAEMTTQMQKNEQTTACVVDELGAELGKAKSLLYEQSHARFESNLTLLGSRPH